MSQPHFHSKRTNVDPTKEFQNEHDSQEPVLKWVDGAENIDASTLAM